MAHHGNTPAAWTGVTIVLVGFFLGGLGLVIGSWVMFWIGVACAPLAGVGIKILQAMGKGTDTHEINAQR